MLFFFFTLYLYNVPFLPIAIIVFYNNLNIFDRMTYKTITECVQSDSNVIQYVLH